MRKNLQRDQPHRRKQRLGRWCVQTAEHAVRILLCDVRRYYVITRASSASWVRRLTAHSLTKLLPPVLAFLRFPFLFSIFFHKCTQSSTTLLTTTQQKAEAHSAATYVSLCCYICVLILLCPHTAIRVLILLYMCPHTATYVS